MKLSDALRLQNEDEVTVKRTNRTMHVVEVVKIPKESTTKFMDCVSVLLEDGEWYGYKEIR